MTYLYDCYNNCYVKTSKRMKHYRIYVQEPNTGDYHYQSTEFDTLTGVLNYCKERYAKNGHNGYISDNRDTKVLRRF